MTNPTHEQIATKLAIDAKATGFDLGCLYDDEWNLSNDEWDAVAARAEELIPTVEVPDDVARDWAQAGRDVDAEIAHERRQLGGY